MPIQTGGLSKVPGGTSAICHKRTDNPAATLWAILACRLRCSRESTWILLLPEEEAEEVRYGLTSAAVANAGNIFDRRSVRHVREARSARRRPCRYLINRGSCPAGASQVVATAAHVQNPKHFPEHDKENKRRDETIAMRGAPDSHRNSE